MGTPYPNTTASGYNASPPADDGSVTSANKVKWATIKTQLSDPLNVVDGAINTALRTALNVTPTSQSSAYTTTTADHQRPIEVTGTTTISLGDAATMVAASMGYEVPIINTGVATVTVAVITAANTLAGKANGTLKLAPLQGVLVTVNSTSNGYDVKAVANGVLFDSTDPTKQARFDVSGITTATTRVVTVPDYNVTLGNIPAGVIMDYGGSAAPTGWLECDGSAVLRTGVNANLFAAIGTTWGAGDGATTFNLPDFRGRTRIGRGTGTEAETVASQTIASNQVAVASNNTKYVTGMPVTISASTITGLTNGSYWVVRVDATHVSFASSLANAQNGTVLTISGTGVLCTITYNLTARTLAEIGGEEAHAMSITELLAHAHAQNANTVLTSAGGVAIPTTGGSLSTGGSTSSVGGNAAMNVMQPFAATMAIIKY